MTLAQFQAALGLLCVVALVAVTFIRHQRLGLEDAGHVIVAFLASANLPPAVVLCSYVFSPDPPDVETKLRGLELFVTLGGVSLVFVAGVALVGQFRRAWSE